MPAFDGHIRKAPPADQDFRRGFFADARSQGVSVRVRQDEDIAGQTHVGNPSRAKGMGGVYAPAEPASGNLHATRAGAMAARRSRKSKREKPLIQRISNAKGESA